MCRMNRLGKLRKDCAHYKKVLANHEEQGYTDEEWHVVTKLKGMVKGLELAVDIMGGNNDETGK